MNIDVVAFIISVVIIIQQILSYKSLAKKTNDYFNPIIFTFFFIYLPFSLSSLKLSNLQTFDYHPYVLVIMFCSSTIIMYISLMIKIPILNNNLRVSITNNKVSKSLSFIVLLNIIYIILYLYENKVVSGFLFPLFSIEEAGDTHLQGVRFVREINTLFRVFLPLANFYLYYVTKEKKYLIYTFITAIVPLSRGSRIAVINSIIIIVAFTLRKVNMKKIMLLIIVSVILIYFSMSLGDHRRVYTDITYGNEVGIYNELLNNNILGESIAWYYGYYSLSFYNFNISLTNWLQDQIHFFGLSNLNGLLSYFISSYPTQDQFNSSLQYVSGASNVPTALYFYLIDFGVIGIFFFDLLFYLILFAVYKRSLNDSFYRLVYCFMLLHVINFVFYSSFYAVYLYPIFIILAIYKRLYYNRLKGVSVYG